MRAGYYLYVLLFYFWFAVHRHQSWASASSLRLSTTSPRLPVGPREDPALGDDVAELGGVHEAFHAVAGAKGEALGVRTGPLDPLHRDGPVAHAEGRAPRLVPMQQRPLAHLLAAPATKPLICDGPRQPDHVAVLVLVAGLEEQVLADDTAGEPPAPAPRVERGGEAVPVLPRPSTSSSLIIRYW